MDLMNGVLDKVKVDITTNTHKAIQFQDEINEQKGLEVVPIPNIINLENHMNDIKANMVHKMAEINNQA